MGTTAALLLPLVFFLTVDHSVGSASAAGRVIAAPHDGFDEFSGAIAKDIARQLRWGWVEATGFRSYPLRHWFDVNRPTERPWRAGRFADDRVTQEALDVFRDYRRKLRLAAQVSQSARVPFLVEIHGHTREVQAGASQLRIQAIELATQGFTTLQLRRLQDRYDRLVREIPQQYRVPLAIDRLDREYEVSGWIVPFYFRASGAKSQGSLQSSEADHALHFELPPRVRDYAAARSAYARLLANLVQSTEADVR